MFDASMPEVLMARVALADARRAPSEFRPLRRATDHQPVASMPEPEAEPDRYAVGYADGERRAIDDFATERAALLALIAAAEALQPEPSEELAALIAHTVERLVTEIVGNAPIDRDWLMQRIDAAVGCIAQADAERTLWLQPDDLALLGDLALPLAARADPLLDRGALRIDCSLGWVEDGRSIHLDALRATFGLGTSA